MHNFAPADPPPKKKLEQLQPYIYKLSLQPGYVQSYQALHDCAAVATVRALVVKVGVSVVMAGNRLVVGVVVAGSRLVVDSGRVV